MPRKDRIPDPTDLPGDEQHEPRPGPSRKAILKVVGLLVVVALIVAFVIQNTTPAKVKLLTFTGHVQLVWLALVCLVVGAVLGFLLARRGRGHGRGKAKRGAGG